MRRIINIFAAVVFVVSAVWCVLSGSQAFLMLVQNPNGIWPTLGALFTPNGMQLLQTAARAGMLNMGVVALAALTLVGLWSVRSHIARWGLLFLLFLPLTLGDAQLLRCAQWVFGANLSGEAYSNLAVLCINAVRTLPFLVAFGLLLGKGAGMGLGRSAILVCIGGIVWAEWNGLCPPMFPTQALLGAQPWTQASLTEWPIAYYSRFGLEPVSAQLFSALLAKVFVLIGGTLMGLVFFSRPRDVEPKPLFGIWVLVAVPSLVLAVLPIALWAMHIQGAEPLALQKLNTWLPTLLACATGSLLGAVFAFPLGYWLRRARRGYQWGVFFAAALLLNVTPSAYWLFTLANGLGLHNTPLPLLLGSMQLAWMTVALALLVSKPSRSLTALCSVFFLQLLLRLGDLSQPLLYIANTDYSMPLSQAVALVEKPNIAVIDPVALGGMGLLLLLSMAFGCLATRQRVLAEGEPVERARTPRRREARPPREARKLSRKERARQAERESLYAPENAREATRDIPILPVDHEIHLEMPAPPEIDPNDFRG